MDQLGPTGASLTRTPAWIGRTALFLLVFVPFAPALDTIVPVRTWGFSLFVTVLPTFCIMGILFALALRSDMRLLAFPLLLAAGGMVITLFRTAWGLDDGVGLPTRLNRVRFTLLIPTYIVIWRVVAEEPRWRRLIVNIMIAVGFVMGSMGLAYSLGFRSLPRPTDPDHLALWMLGTKYGGFTQPNAYGALIVLVFFLIAFSQLKNRAQVWIFVIPVMFVGLMSSLSRWSITAGILVLAYAAISAKRIPLMKVAIIVVFLGVVYGNSANIKYMADRITFMSVGARGTLSNVILGNIESRVNKSKIGLAAIMKTPTTVMFGARTSDLIGPSQQDTFSDNGFVLIAARVGLPFTVLFLGMCGYLLLFGHGVRTFQTIVFFLWISGTILMNNAVIWESWIFLAAATYFAILFNDVNAGRKLRIRGG